MYTIYLNSKDKGIGLNEFQNKMIEICNEHQNKGRALAFAFLIYDFSNPHLWKILNDREYWMALNEISGKYLTVFSFNYKEIPKKRKTKSSFKGMEYLTMVNTSINLKDATQILKEKYFSSSDFSFPSILFFQVKNNQVTDSLAIELREEKIEESFIEIKKYIQAGVNSLKEITDENKKNYDEIFELLSHNVESLKTKNKIIRTTKNLGNVIGLISSIKGLFLNSG